MSDDNLCGHWVTRNGNEFHDVCAAEDISARTDELWKSLYFLLTDIDYTNEQTAFFSECYHYINMDRYMKRHGVRQSNCNFDIVNDIWWQIYHYVK